MKRNSIFAYYKEVRQVIEIYLEKIGFFENIVPNGVVGLISALHIYKKTNLRQLRKILNQVSLYKLDTDIKNEFLVYLLFNKNNLEEFTISSIKEDLMKLAEYCLVEDIIGYESGIPENLSEARRDYIKEHLFKSEINSGLLELFIKNLKKKDQEYFKFSDGIEELFIDDLYSNDTFLEKWKTYLNI